MIVYNQLFVYKTYVVNHWKVLCYMHCWGMQVIDMLISRIWLKVDDDDDFQSVEPAQRDHGLKICIGNVLKSADVGTHLHTCAHPTHTHWCLLMPLTW